jgi:hypothetical protein
MDRKTANGDIKEACCASDLPKSIWTLDILILDDGSYQKLL